MALSTERRDRMTPLEKDSVRPEPDALSAGLYVVATPIGRLSDLSLRATDVLRRVDALGAEDTRVSRQLLDHIGARPTLIACHAHNEARTAQALVERIRTGQAVALISDAGTPGISDPGARVVAAVHAAGLPVIPVPGPSAVVTLLSAAGFLEPRFRFEGFLPARATARRERLQELACSQDVVVFYESPHRIVETLDDLANAVEPERMVVVGRELTKRFEQIHRAAASTLPQWLAEDSDRRRGEFVIALDAAPSADTLQATDAVPMDALLRALCAELPVRQAARMAAQASGLRANDLYKRAVALRGRAASEADLSDTDVTDDADQA
jgi:16S rRNA (cytidine1402-2'-O)-methyltransferase